MNLLEPEFLKRKTKLNANVIQTEMLNVNEQI